MSKPAKPVKRYEMKAAGKKADIYIYEDIGEGWFGGLSAKRFADDLNKLGAVDEIIVHMNSAGGNVFDGVAIYNTLKKHRARVVMEIDGLAASIASIIAMAGDEIRMASNGFMMIHDPWIMTSGSADELREQADIMDKIKETLVDTYCARSKCDREKMAALMKDETWMSAQEAMDLGLVDSLTDPMQIAACAGERELSRFKRAPDALKQAAASVKAPRRDNVRGRLASMDMRLRRHKL